MRKAVLCLTLCALVFTPRVSAWAQQPRKLHRIGYISATDRVTDSTRSDAIRLALRERGYIEAQNLAIEYRYADGNRDRYTELLAELVRLKVDLVVVAGGDPLIRAAINATKAIPIVMTGGGADPVEAGLVESLASPSGNTTGITNLTTELGGKRLELLKESVPKLASVAVLYDPVLPAAVRDVKEVLPVAAGGLGLTVQPLEVRGADSLEKVFATLSTKRPDGVYVLGGAVIRANGKRIVGFALKSRLPSTYFLREPVEAGGLMHYGADLSEVYRRVAYFVDRILKGAKPANLPIEQLTKFEFIINLKTANQIGLTIPPNVLARADRVIR